MRGNDSAIDAGEHDQPVGNKQRLMKIMGDEKRGKTAPTGGAHQDAVESARRLGIKVRQHLGELLGKSESELLERRYAKFRAMGQFSEG